MLLEVAELFALGFIVGLSGAIIPGPLFAFTVLDTNQKGKVTAHEIILGHVVWEAGIVAVLLLGFGYFLIDFKWIIFLVGGAVMFTMGIFTMLNKDSETKMIRRRVDSSFLGGIFYTALNPSQPPWWATAGLALLLTGIELMGLLGALIVTLGHWVSDLAYYISVSFVVHRHEKFISPRQRQVKMILGAFLAALGTYFVISSFIDV